MRREHWVNENLRKKHLWPKSEAHSKLSQTTKIEIFSEILKAINYFHKKFYLSYLIGF